MTTLFHKYPFIVFDQQSTNHEISYTHCIGAIHIHFCIYMSAIQNRVTILQRLDFSTRSRIGSGCSALLVRHLADIPLPLNTQTARQLIYAEQLTAKFMIQTHSFWISSSLSMPEPKALTWKKRHKPAIIPWDYSNVTLSIFGIRIKTLNVILSHIHSPIFCKQKWPRLAMLFSVDSFDGNTRDQFLRPAMHW